MSWFVYLSVVVLGGYLVACWLMGENLLVVWWDEWRLARVSLEEVIEAAARNPRESELVVSLTTIPSRIGELEPTIKSLVRQSARAREIRVCVPTWSKRENCAYEVPEWLRRVPRVVIAACEDEGPATKYLPSLRSVAAEQAVVVVDDDRIYHPRLLELLAVLAKKHPDEVVSAAGWDAPKDRVDRPTTLWGRMTGAAYVPVRGNQVWSPRAVDIVQGLHGYVVRPRFFDLVAMSDFSRAPQALRFVDDVWISGHCRAAKRVHPLRLTFTDYKPRAKARHYDRTSLGRNFNRAENYTERGNSVGLRFFSARWRH